MFRLSRFLTLFQLQCRGASIHRHPRERNQSGYIHLLYPPRRRRICRPHRHLSRKSHRADREGVRRPRSAPYPRCRASHQCARVFARRPISTCVRRTLQPATGGQSRHLRQPAQRHQRVPAMRRQRLDLPRLGRPSQGPDVDVTRAEQPGARAVLPRPGRPRELSQK